MQLVVTREERKGKYSRSHESLVDLHLTKMKTLPSLSKDFAYAMTPLKILSWPVGTWPLQNYNIFSFMRAIITLVFLV